MTTMIKVQHYVFESRSFSRPEFFRFPSRVLPVNGNNYIDQWADFKWVTLTPSTSK